MLTKLFQMKIVQITYIRTSSRASICICIHSTKNQANLDQMMQLSLSTRHDQILIETI